MTSPDYKIEFTTFHNVIDNELTKTAETRRTVCSSTEELLWECPVSTQADVAKAVSGAKAAYPAWRKLSQDERADYINKFADAIEANQQEFVELLSREAGKPPQASSFEVSVVLALARETAKLRLKEEKPEDNADRTAIVRHVPLGVGVGIVPWNFPMALGVGKLFPALLAGNTFVWKPSPYSPYSALKLAEVGAKVLPAGVFQALSGEDNLGPMLTAHPDVAKVSFTGSTETGKRVMASCAATLKRVTLELGGNDASIVLPDVDIDTVAAKVAFLAFAHTGQVCMSIKRIYVHESIYDKFLAALVAVVKQFTIGDYADAAAVLGPVQNSMQFGKLQDLYAQIDKEGWKVAVGGALEKKEKGFFLTPTIIDNPPENSRIVTEEPFGPIVPVMKWSDEEDVISRANGTNMGLGASVWGTDVAHAKQVAEQLEAGSIWVNTHFEVAPNVPFGGHKHSGMGMDWGDVGLQGWCNPQAYWVKHA